MAKCELKAEADQQRAIMKGLEAEYGKANLPSFPEVYVRYLEAKMGYHNFMAEHWDGRVGSVYNDDDRCTAEWDKHCKLMDKTLKELKKYATQEGLRYPLKLLQKTLA